MWRLTVNWTFWFFDFLGFLFMMIRLQKWTLLHLNTIDEKAFDIILLDFVSSGFAMTSWKFLVEKDI